MKSPLITSLQDRFRNERAVRAAIRHINRKDGDEHPAGKYDRAGRWFPDASERLPLSCYRTPSRRFPNSYRDACKSMLHCAILEGEEDPLLVRRIVNSIGKASKEQDQAVGIAKAEADILRHLADGVKRRKKLKDAATPNAAEQLILATATA